MRKPVSLMALLLALGMFAVAPAVVPAGPFGAKPALADDDGGDRDDDGGDRDDDDGRDDDSDDDDRSFSKKADKKSDGKVKKKKKNKKSWADRDDD